MAAGGSPQPTSKRSLGVRKTARRYQPVRCQRNVVRDALAGRYTSDPLFHRGANISSRAHLLIIGQDWRSWDLEIKLDAGGKGARQPGTDTRWTLSDNVDLIRYIAYIEV